MSINWHLDVDPAPAILVLPPAVASLDEAHAAIELWEYYSRKRLDSTQRLTVEVMMATREDGRWAASTTGREMPRQNGKGDEIEVVELWGLVQRSEAILHTVHDAVLLASKAQQRLLGTLDRHLDLRRLVKRRWQGTGQQMIEMRNDGIIWYRTRTGGGGRGVDDVDRLVVDEAQHATEEHLAAVAPTLLANSNPQMNAMGTSGLGGKSAWWWSVRKRALSTDPGEFGYVGHTAERVFLDSQGRVEQPTVDVDDRALWRASNPSIAAGRGQGMQFLEEQLRRLGPGAFAQEHLGVWEPDPDLEAGSVIPLEVWDGNADDSTWEPVGVPTFAVDITGDRSQTTIGLACWRPDERPQVEIAAAGPDTHWVVPWLAERRKKYGRRMKVMYNASGPAGSLAADMTAARIEFVPVSPREMAQACGLFFDETMAGVLMHLDDRRLAISVSSTSARSMSDAWVWDLRKPGPVSPLLAVTLARFGLPPFRRPQPRVVSLADALAAHDAQEGNR